jgi:hypothetical protein
MRPPSRAKVQFDLADPERHPVLTAASRASKLNSRQIFEQTIRSYLLGVAHFGALDPEATAQARADLGAAATSDASLDATG